MTRRAPRRTLSAAMLLVAALAALLVAWFLSGWADVRAQQRELRAAPAREAAEKGSELAHDLRAELARILAREVERPYFHYQNLMHDPRSGANLGVSPSPLASGPQDPLVLGYFQVDSTGKVSTPPINDDLPDLSEPKNHAGNARFRDEVARNFVASVQPAPVEAGGGQGTLVASAGQPPQQQANPRAQVVEIDESSYTQNALPTAVYRQQQAGPRVSRDLLEQRANPPVPQPATPPTPQAAPPVPQRAAPAGDRPIMIMISPLEWRTLPYGGQPALVAVRHVETPDGGLAQGFVVDRASLTSWLASRAGEALAEVKAGPEANKEAHAAEIAPGWYLDVAASPHAIAEATAEAATVATGFLVRFVIVGVIALGAAALVVMLVSRAERLARERSQFAAAAAHELRTPLAGLQLYGDMLADGLGDPSKLRDYARRMSEEASRLGRVVSNVLGFSQLERGNLSIDARPGDLGAALCELAERAQPALDRAGAALELDVPPELSAKYDRDALARIVGNLLDNAEKYGRDAEDRTIGLAARDAGDHVEVLVTDQGPGVAPAARGKLFRAFTRGVSSDGPAGLGLGLALSQSLARAMGGDLEHRPGPERGATFVLRLAKP
ncbi:MAG TPA: HAMP domain-containing sensor histidine kinase [Kofleriaceae bacterium]|nr:HAMP domain-containing sensor histidine kinase [Kofleriaceae bacterium]